MTESKSKKLPKFDSDPELIEFFETHDMGEYESELSEVNFDVDIKQSHYLVSIDRSLILVQNKPESDRLDAIGTLLEAYEKAHLGGRLFPSTKASKQLSHQRATTN